MEKSEQQPKPAIELETILADLIPNEQLLQFAADGVSLYGLVASGDTRTTSLKVGESEMVIKVPTKEPMLLRQAVTVEDVLAPQKYVNDFEPPKYATDITGEIQDSDFESWQDGLVKPEQIKEAAEEELLRRDVEGDTEFLPCGNCKGKMQFDIGCSCTEGGMTFIDMTHESPAETISQREKGVADPDCQKCGGEGHFMNNCPACAGSGTMLKYPTLVIVNELTDERRAIRLDVAAMIVAGATEVTMYEEDKQLPSAISSSRVLKFNTSDYVERVMDDMGIDIENSGRMMNGFMVDVMTGRLNTIGQEVFWRKFGPDGKVISGQGRNRVNTPEEAKSASEILADAQSDMARNFARANDTSGLDEWILRPRRPMMEALEDLKSVVLANGYTLGLMHSFIATGQVGPSFYLLRDNGTPVIQLSNDYTLRESVENAWLAFQELSNGTTD